MAKLGSKQRPAFLRAKTQKRAEELLAMTLAGGFHAIVSVDPDQPEDYRDFQALLGRLQRERGIPEPRGMVPLPTYVPSAENEARSVHVSAASGLPLPPGHYTFLEYFCAEPGCDCRRVVLYVVHEEERRVLAVINYAFDPVDEDGAEHHDGQWFLDPLHEQSERAEVALALFERVLLNDTVFVERVERHYRDFKSAVDAEARAQGPRTIAAKVARLPGNAAAEERRRQRNRAKRARR